MNSKIVVSEKRVLRAVLSHNDLIFDGQAEAELAYTKAMLESVRMGAQTNKLQNRIARQRRSLRESRRLIQLFATHPSIGVLVKQLLKDHGRPARNPVLTEKQARAIGRVWVSDDEKLSTRGLLSS